MKCPKCGGSLARHSYSESVAVARCHACHGMLLEAGMLERIREAVRADEFFDIGHPKVGRALDRPGSYSCPACGAAMDTRPHPTQPHVRIENCAGCGAIFLDAGELLDLSHESLLERIWDALTGRLRAG
jgi:Zn-finger nucleic acid-binding protein